MKITVKELREFLRESVLIKEEVLPREFVRRFDTDLSQITTTAKEIWETARELRSTNDRDTFFDVLELLGKLEQQVRAAKDTIQLLPPAQETTRKLG